MAAIQLKSSLDSGCNCFFCLLGFLKFCFVLFFVLFAFLGGVVGFYFFREHGILEKFQPVYIITVILFAHSNKLLLFYYYYYHHYYYYYHHHPSARLAIGKE